MTYTKSAACRMCKATNGAPSASRNVRGAEESSRWMSRRRRNRWMHTVNEPLLAIEPVQKATPSQRCNRVPSSITAARMTVSVLSAAACIVLCAEWKQSHGTANRVYGHVCGDRGLLLAWQEGRFAAVTFACDSQHIPWRWKSNNYPIDDDRSCPIGAMPSYPTRHGFAWIDRPREMSEMWYNPIRGDRPHRIDRATVVAKGFLVPLWCLVMLSGSVSIIPWIRMRFGLCTLLAATTLAALVLGLVVAPRQHRFW